jgi:FMN phosphatase YigB (HAD superfamily)
MDSQSVSLQKHKPKAIVFDLLTALLDSWSLWNLAAGSASLGHAWRAHYLSLTYGCGAYRPYEVPGVLARLRERGYALAVLTNCSAELGRRAAGRCGEGFDVVVTAEEAGFYKPHPAAYAKVLEVLGITAEDALFVAGSAADVPGAAAAGMRVVWHNRIGLARKPGPEPEKEARTLGEVLEGVVL